MRVLGLTLLLMAGQASAANGERLYATCAACHGTAGAGIGDALPRLAGQPRDKLVESMRAFRSGERPATIMHQISKGYTAQQVEAIAEYLARQK